MGGKVPSVAGDHLARRCAIDAGLNLLPGDTARTAVQGAYICDALTHVAHIAYIAVAVLVKKLVIVVRNRFNHDCDRFIDISAGANSGNGPRPYAPVGDLDTVTILLRLVGSGLKDLQIKPGTAIGTGHG
jgi:hypothetical protein